MKTFSIKLTRDAQEVIAKCKATAEKNRVHFDGDHQQGKFNGMGIEGHYDIKGSDLTVTIEKKPMLLTWSLIESKMRELFA